MVVEKCIAGFVGNLRNQFGVICQGAAVFREQAHSMISWDAYEPKRDRSVEVDQKDTELRSLLSLLDDPDHRVASAVTDRLRLRGQAVLNPLLDFIDFAPDPLARERAETLAREFNEEILLAEFRKLERRIEQGDPKTLEDGAFLIARFATPRLNVQHYRNELTRLGEALNEFLFGIDSPLEMLITTNSFFFDEQKFKGNEKTFLDPDNSYIHAVLDRKLGIPISLALVYILVARDRVGLPFSGSSTPGHFLIRYDGVQNEPLFVDAFNGGLILKQRDIRRFLEVSKLPFDELFLRPASPRAFLLRMIRNLIIVFTERKEEASRQAFERFLRVLAPSSEQSDLQNDTL